MLSHNHGVKGTCGRRVTQGVLRGGTQKRTKRLTSFTLPKEGQSVGEGNASTGRREKKTNQSQGTNGALVARPPHPSANTFGKSSQKGEKGPIKTAEGPKKKEYRSSFHPGEGIKRT